MARAPRKAAIEKPDEPVASKPPVEITNTSTSTTLHIGDGRKLAPGESIARSEISDKQAEALRASGFCK